MPQLAMPKFEIGPRSTESRSRAEKPSADDQTHSKSEFADEPTSFMGTRLLSLTNPPKAKEGPQGTDTSR